MSYYDDAEPEVELDLTPPAVGAQYHPAETEETLLALREVIETARDVPLSASSMIQKDEVIALIDDALESLPEELRAARWLLKEREDFLARMRHEAEDTIEQARNRAERMVQRTEVVKAAEQRAYEIVEAAQADARRLRHEVEDFCDQKLASFEIVLERTQKLVSAGRSKLQGTNLLAEAAAAAEHGIGGSAETVADDEFEQLESIPSPGVYNELSNLDGESDLYDDEGEYATDLTYDAPAWDGGELPFDEAEQRPRLTVVDDRYADLPPPPDARPETIRDAAANFFDQDVD